MSDQKDAVMQDMFGVFNKKAADVNLVNEQEGSSLFFNPDSKKSPGQVFRGSVKFLPNLHDMDNMMVEKTTYWVPEGDKGFRFDSAKSVEKYADCPVNDAYWEMKNSDDARLKAAAEKIKYGRNTYVLVQVLKDLTNPDNNGKIMAWNVPFAIVKKIRAKMYPTKEDVEMSGAVANNPFDPINGLPLILKIPIKSVTENGKTSEYRDYDECIFGQSPQGVILAGETSPVVMSDDPAVQQTQQEAILKTILAGPNLQDHAYKEPSAEVFTRVKSAIAALKGQAGHAQAAPIKEAPKTEAPKTEAPKTETVTETAPKTEASKTETAEKSTSVDADQKILDDLGFNDEK